MNIQRATNQYFRHAWVGANGHEIVFVAIAIALILLAAMIPTGYRRPDDASVRAKAEVLETFNQGVKNYGVLMQGEQIARVRVLDGPYSGLEAEATNILYGKADMDKIFQPGDRALVVIHPAADKSPAEITIMDLAMNVAASIEEIDQKRPGLGFLELVKSGFNVGRKVIGTMSTTLLLAYTGGFTSLLTVFMAQGVPALNTFNMVYVSSEVLIR